jgi:hypothetical protein
VSCVLLAVSSIVFSGCSANSPNSVTPYIPPNYYASQLVLPFDLSNIYWSPYITRSDAAKLHGNIYVFKDLKVNDITMASIKEGYVWVDLIKAYALNPANLKELRLGESIDVVGVLAGPCNDFPKSLTFSACVFLEAGSVSMPVGGDGSSLQYVPTY